VLHGQTELRVSASMGVTLYPQDGTEVDLLMRQADQAMYAAKQAGKNRYHLFDIHQDAAMRQQRDSLVHMQQALEHGEFELYFQPKVNLRSNAVVGAEALIRWNHTERGLLSPAAFLPVIENHPLSIEVGEWVIRSALAQISCWQTAGLALPVSVNISALQLQQPDFPARLRALLDAFADVHPAQLELEVLETSDFEDLARVQTIISECQAMGVRFALDDFGTGYSSLVYINHLAVETLKIDRSFVRDMLDDPNDLAIVNGVVGLAHAFGRQVVAEGVETAEHRDLLLSIGCELAQGFGIARPMPAASLPDWIKQWQRKPDGAYLHYPLVPA
jgi:EAL domain-containing protein (putative c-di-GMP-specific phosphodiesterase class I)